MEGEEGGVGVFRQTVVSMITHLVGLPSSVARRNSCGDSTVRKYAVCASAVENWTTALRGGTILTSTERGASGVENLGPPRY